MKPLEDLENRVKNLPSDQLARFRDWFYAFDREVWDRRIEADSKAGRFDRLAADALAEFAAGNAREI